MLYGDTDSVFVRSGMETEAARSAGPALAADLNRAVAEHVRARWDVASRLELEFEKLYVKLFLPSVRHGGAGARKRYAGLVDGRDDVEFAGMEVVRRDWTTPELGSVFATGAPSAPTKRNVSAIATGTFVKSLSSFFMSTLQGR